LCECRSLQVLVVGENDACWSSSVGAVSTCLHGGSCVATSDGSRCRCRWGDRGATCSKSAWTFQSLSYVEHSDVAVVVDDGASFGVEFDVATVERQALVLLASGGPRVFVGVEVVDGRVRLSYRGSDGEVRRVNAPGAVSDGLWHHVVATITNTVCKDVVSCASIACNTLQ